MSVINWDPLDSFQTWYLSLISVQGRSDMSVTQVWQTVLLETEINYLSSVHVPYLSWHVCSTRLLWKTGKNVSRWPLEIFFSFLVFFSYSPKRPSINLDYFCDPWLLRPDWSPLWATCLTSMGPESWFDTIPPTSHMSRGLDVFSVGEDICKTNTF